MTNQRLHQQIAFVVEIDRLKLVLRQTLLMAASRRENSAEHSWHLETAQH
jgi:putative hydrolase of HD superfamily